jgi:hypothetical protein
MLKNREAVHFGHLDVEKEDAGQRGGTGFAILSPPVKVVQTLLPVVDDIERVGDMMHLPCPLGGHNIVLIVLSHKDDKRLPIHIYLFS